MKHSWKLFQNKTLEKQIENHVETNKKEAEKALQNTPESAIVIDHEAPIIDESIGDNLDESTMVNELETEVKIQEVAVSKIEMPSKKKRTKKNKTKE